MGSIHMSFNNKVRILILQHPQEPKETLNTARLVISQLAHSTLKPGLSWRNLKHATGDPEAKPSDWAVLYLGTGLPPEVKKMLQDRTRTEPQLVFLDRAKSLTRDPSSVVHEIKGLIVLDGTWSQAKTLWWRNAWLTRLRRAILIPVRPSLYGKIRKEPRRECLSTIESVAMALTALREDPSIESGLMGEFESFLAGHR